MNVLVHALQHFKLSHIYFVSVIEHGYANEDEAEDRLSAIRARVDQRLLELSRGVYTGKGDSEVPIGPEHADLYRDCYERLEKLENTNIVVPWVDLDSKLAFYSADGNGIFDVTALKKNLLVDVVVLLLSRGCTKVYDFEILKKGQRTYDERELIHNLKDSDYLVSGDFVYRNLADNDHVRKAERRMVAQSLRFRSLIVIAIAVIVVVLVVQIFFPKSWPETLVTTAATAAAIAGFLFLLRRD